MARSSVNSQLLPLGLPPAEPAGVAREISVLAATHIEADLSSCYPFGPRFISRVVAPDTIEMTSDELLRLEAADRAQTAAALASASRSASPGITTIHLEDELVPLFDYLNSLVSERRPMILHDGSGQPARVYGRAAPTRFSPHPVQVQVDTFDYVGSNGAPVQPLGFRRQLLLSLLQVGTVDRPRVPDRNAASVTERRRGSLRAPIVFELSVTGEQSRPDGPYFRFLLSARCEETARWQAVRRQVCQLIAHLRDPANLLPREFALEALPSNQSLNMYRLSVSQLSRNNTTI